MPKEVEEDTRVSRRSIFSRRPKKVTVEHTVCGLVDVMFIFAM